MKWKITTISGLLITVMSLSSVLAGTSYVDFSTTVGKFNGSGYTAYQKKEYSGASGYVTGFYSGGYNSDIRMIDEDGNKGSWARDYGVTNQSGGVGSLIYT